MPRDCSSPSHAQHRCAGEGLVLDDSLFQEDVVILDRFASRSLTYGAGVGGRIRVGFPDATQLGIWTKPGAPFICIEPWRGVADPQDFKGELPNKPGVFMCRPVGAKH